MLKWGWLTLQACQHCVCMEKSTLHKSVNYKGKCPLGSLPPDKLLAAFPRCINKEAESDWPMLLPPSQMAVEGEDPPLGEASGPQHQNP